MQTLTRLVLEEHVNYINCGYLFPNNRTKLLTKRDSIPIVIWEKISKALTATLFSIISPPMDF